MLRWKCMAVYFLHMRTTVCSHATILRVLQGKLISPWWQFLVLVVASCTRRIKGCRASYSSFDKLPRVRTYSLSPSKAVQYTVTNLAAKTCYIHVYLCTCALAVKSCCYVSDKLLTPQWVSVDTPWPITTCISKSSTCEVVKKQSQSVWNSPSRKVP